MSFIFSNAFAQEAGKAVPGGPMAGFIQFVPFVLIFVVFYFLMIRPQKKKMQQEQVLLNNLQKGDEVFTKAGMLGTITGMNEKIITMEVSEGVKIKMLRTQIAGPSKTLFEKAQAEKK